MKPNILGVLNFHTSPDVSPLTDSRALGSTSFLGRYALCDFSLSNFCNSDIQSIGILIKEHPRSVLKHLAAGNAWVKNTKRGNLTTMYNEPAHKGDLSLNTDVANLQENSWVFYSNAYSHVVFMPANLVASIDLRPYLERHISLGRKVTVVAKKCQDLSQEGYGSAVLSVDEGARVKAIRANDCKEKGSGYLSLGIIIINRDTLASLMRKYIPEHPSANLSDLLQLASLKEDADFGAYMEEFDGYSRLVDNYIHYLDYSFELLNQKNASALFRSDWPIYTKTHNTPPALYGPNSHVTDSYVANGAQIEGEVSHSIICRSVKIGKGAVVRNAIVFTESEIGENAHVESALIDKYCYLGNGSNFVGNNEFIYLKQGAIL